MLRTRAILFLAVTSCLAAQRAFEVSGRVVYEDAAGNQTNLGAGFNPLLQNNGSLVFLRGRKFGYGEKFNCAEAQGKNWVATYDPKTKEERVLLIEHCLLTAPWVLCL